MRGGGRIGGGGGIELVGAWCSVLCAGYDEELG